MGHLISGGSFEISGCKFGILQLDIRVMTEPRAQPWDLVAKGPIVDVWDSES